MSASSKASQPNTQKGEAVKIVFDAESDEPQISSSQYGDKHLNGGMKAMNAVFKTENAIDQNIMSTMYLQSFNEWAKAGNFTLASSIH